MKTQKPYKPCFINNYRMLPSDLTGSLDDFNRKNYKLKDIINNIQVPGMALWSNAGLPILFLLSIFYVSYGGIDEKSHCLC